MNIKKSKDYNERMLSGKISRFYHLSRFKFLKDSITKYNIKTNYVVEIGCCDARSLEYFPKLPKVYIGIDANWEGLLDIAKIKYEKYPNYHFIEGTAPDCLEKFNYIYDFALSLETFEHLEDNVMWMYINFLKKYVNGIILITVPVEFGPIFFLKYIVKKFIYHDDYKEDRDLHFYDFWEVLKASLFLISRVKREYGYHKGFDYRKLLSTIEKNFKIVEITGIPLKLKPLFLNFTIGLLLENQIK